MSRPVRLARSLSSRRRAALGTPFTTALFAAVLSALTGCGGARTTTPSRASIDAVRARATAAPGDANVQRELASAELLLEGGEPARVPDALSRAARLAPDDARVRYLQALEDDGKGRLDAAFEAYLGALGKASAGADAVSQAIAEASLSALADLVDVVPRGRERLRAVLEPLHAAPASLGLAARHHLAELLFDQAWRRGERDTVRAIAAHLGCPAEWRVAGPFGPRELLGFDETSPAEGRGPLADRYDLGPGRGTRPTRTLEPRGCGVNLGGGAISAAGTSVAEARLTVTRAGRYTLRLETPNSVALSVDGAPVARLDARRDPLGRTSLHTLDLTAGEHELEVKVTTRHPNPILVVSLAPAVAADDVALPAADAASPLEQYLAASLAIARGDIVAARERAQPIAARPDVTAPWLVLRAAIALGDPLVPADVRRDDARALLRRAMRRDEGLWYPILQSARLDAADGRVVEAIGIVRVGLERFPGVLGFAMTLAELYQSKGWTADADDTLRHAAAALPGACSVQRGLFDALRRRDRHPEARALVETLLACDARSNLRFQLLRDLRRWDEAATELTRLAALEPRQSRVGLIGPELELARQRGDAATVARLLTELDTASPLSPFAPLSRADLALAQGDAPSAHQLLDAALRREPGAMGELHRVRRAIGGADDLAAYRKDGAAILRDFLASGRSYTQPQVLVFDYAATRVYPDGSSLQLVHQIYRVQSDEAVNQHGEFQLPEGARLLTLHTIKADGRRMEPDEIAGKDTISLPALAVGDFVESEYVVLSEPSGSFPGGFVGERFYFQSAEVPFDTTSQVYVVPRGLPIVLDPRGPAPTAEERVDGDLRVLAFTVRESRPIVPEPGTVNGREFLPSIQVAVRADWRTFVDGMRDVLADRDVRDPAAARLVAGIVAGAGDADAKARRLYAWTLENVESSEAFFGSAPAMLAARTGNRVRVLRYLLDLAGIPADLVAVRSRAADATVSEVADAETYASALLRLSLPGGTVWLSGNERWTPYGYVPTLLRGQEGLVLAPGAPRVRVADAPAASELHEVAAEIHLGTGGAARIEVTETFRGAGASGWRGQLEEIPAAELERRFEQGYVARLLPGAELSTLAIEGRDNPDVPLVVTYTFTVADLGRRTGGRWLVPGLFPLQLGASLAPLASRTTPQLVPSESDERITLRFHAAETALPTPPAPTALRGPGGASFTWRASRAPGTYTVERRVQVPIQRVAPADYPALADFCRRADEAEARDVAFTVR